MYYLNEGSLAIPDGWYDQTLNVISVAPPNTEGLTFTIARDPIPWGMEFGEYVAGQIEKSRQVLKNFDMVAKRDLPIGGLPACEIECRWESNYGPVHQVIATLALPRNALIVSASMKNTMTDAQLTQVRAIIASFKPRPDHGG